MISFFFFFFLCQDRIIGGNYSDIVWSLARGLLYRPELSRAQLRLTSTD